MKDYDVPGKTKCDDCGYEGKYRYRERERSNGNIKTMLVCPKCKRETIISEIEPNGTINDLRAWT